MPAVPRPSRTARRARRGWRREQELGPDRVDLRGDRLAREQQIERLHSGRTHRRPIGHGGRRAMGSEQRDDLAGTDAIAAQPLRGRREQPTERDRASDYRGSVERATQIDQRLAIGVAREPLADERADVQDNALSSALALAIQNRCAPVRCRQTPCFLHLRAPSFGGLSPGRVRKSSARPHGRVKRDRPAGTLAFGFATAVGQRPFCPHTGLGSHRPLCPVFFVLRLDGLARGLPLRVGPMPQRVIFG